MSERLESSLHKWALDLTRRHKVFKHDEPLTPQHFSNLTRDERLQPILSFLIRHVRPPEEQRQIRLNLKHAQLRKKLAGTECDVSASEERFRMKAAIMDAQSALSSEASDIQQMTQKKEELLQRSAELKRRSTLLKDVDEERKKNTEWCLSCNIQLNSLLNPFPVNGGKYSSSSVIEPNFQWLLRNHLSSFEALYRSVMSRDSKSVDELRLEKVELWEHVGKVIEDWCPRILLAAILSEVREATRNVQSLVQRVDLTRDARELRFKCEKDGSFIDEMNPVGVIESVRELLNQMDAANVKLYLETRQVDQATASLSSVLKAVKNNLCAAVKRNYDESVTAAVISFVEENIALIGERAALNMTHTLATSLKERAETAARARDTLMAKYAKMTSFDKEVNSRLEDIYELAAYVTESQDSINNLIDKVKLDVNATLESTSLPTPYSEDSFSTESKILADLPLSYLLTANIDGNEIKQKAFMTTNSLVWYDRNIAEAGYSALASLGLGHLCWDEVYNVIVTRMNDITCLKNQMKRLSNLKAAVSSAEKKTKVLSKQEVKELTDTALKSDAKLERAITKLVDSNEKRITEGHHQLDRLRRVLNEWWEQPAKKVVIRELE